VSIVLERSARASTGMPAAISPSGRMIATLQGATGGFVSSSREQADGQLHTQLLVGPVDPSGGRTPLQAVHSSLQWPWIVGWADEQHLLVVNQVSPPDAKYPDDPNARYALDSVDVDTGQVTQVAAMSDEQTSVGAIFAASLLGAPTRDFPAPPSPLNQRLEAGLVLGVLLLGGVALVVWRRRVRP
jgi:hypothetical protein